MARQLNPQRSNTFKEETKDEIPFGDGAPASKEKTGKKTREKKEKPPKAPKPPREKKVRSEKDQAKLERRFRIFGLAFLLLSFYLLFAFTSYILTWQSDFSFTDTVFKHFSAEGFFENKFPVENWM